MDKDKVVEARELHGTIDFIGLRAHATAVGLIQLSAELLRAGVLDGDAIERIKDAIQREISVSNPRGIATEEFGQSLRQRLDAIFPRNDGSQNRSDLGPASEFGSALKLTPQGQ